MCACLIDGRACFWGNRGGSLRVRGSGGGATGVLGAHACLPACVCLCVAQLLSETQNDEWLSATFRSRGLNPTASAGARRLTFLLCSHLLLATSVFSHLLVALRAEEDPPPPLLCICRLVKTGRRRGELTFQWEWGGELGSAAEQTFECFHLRGQRKKKRELIRD